MRWKRRGVLRTVSGATIGGATVQIYLAGTTTPVTAYEATSGGAVVNQISADNQGRYEYYVDSADYNAATRFKEVITSGSTSTTLDNIPIVRWDPTVDQSLDGALTITGAGNGITLPGELTINSAGNGITFPDGTRMTSNAAPGSGVTNTGDVSIAADSDADGVGEITLSTKGVTRARVPNAGGLEINDSGAWRQTATQDGAETLSNKTFSTPAIGDFSNAQHNHSGPAGGGALSSITITDATLNGSLSGAAIKDEDDMASNSATAVPTQQSVKAYVDGQVGASKSPIRFNKVGLMTVQDGIAYIPASVAAVISKVRVAVVTAPSGGNFVIRILKNGVSNIFPPGSLSFSSGNTYATTTSLQNNTLTESDYLRLDVMGANGAQDMMLTIYF